MNRNRLTQTSTVTLFVLMIIVPTLSAAPAGFVKDSLSLDYSCSSVFAVDANGLVYYGHDTSTMHRTAPPSRKNRGMSNQIWTKDPVSGTETLFYNASLHPGSNQINSASSIAIDDTVTPWMYYITDQNPADDPWTHGAVWGAMDLNDDGDINDSGESFLMTADDAFIYIEGIAFDSISGDAFISSAEGTAGSTMIYRLNDNVVSDNFFDAAEIHPYFDEPGACYAGKLLLDTATGIIYTVDSGGNVYALDDINGDGDCYDAGETAVLENSLVGGFGIAMDPNGNLFITGSDYMTSAHHLYKIELTTPATTTIFHDLSAEVGWTGPVVFDNGASFEPGVTGAILYAAYSDTMWADPDNLLTFQGQTPDVPSMSLWSILIAIIAVGALIILKK